jgi:hypothetical protein
MVAGDTLRLNWYAMTVGTVTGDMAMKCGNEQPAGISARCDCGCTGIKLLDDQGSLPRPRLRASFLNIRLVTKHLAE